MEFLYKLTLIDRLVPEENWTESDKDIVYEHYNNLLKLKEKGILLLAGKTSGQDKDTMGIVIFKADSMKEAKGIMNNDPAIMNGIMTGRLWEYNTAVHNQTYKKD